MVPCRLTGKPFWQIYAYQDPPLWKAHIAALNYFDLDGGFELEGFGPVDPLADDTRIVWEERVVRRNPDGSFATQNYNRDTGEWARHVVVYTADNPPATGVLPEKIGLPAKPSEWEPLPGVTEWPLGMEAWLLAKKEMGDRGVIGMWCGACTSLIDNPEQVYAFHDDPKPFFERAERVMANVETAIKKIAALEVKPDFLFCGSSGSLIWQTPQTFRELALPILKRTTQLAAELGIPTHVHSCGPQAAMVQMAAEETCLTIIDPLEVPPMGDCNLAELKKKFGHRIVLKGNLHTTEVMLRGTPEDVRRASRQAIADAAGGGGFILSTGDQCGRDTPDANLHAMVETARTYGKY